MKKITLLFGCAAFILRIGHSQSTTSYGENAGSLGQANSFFGNGAGTIQNEPFSNYNTAIGSSSMNLHARGEYNTAIGAVSLSYGGQGCTAIGYAALGTNSYYPYPPAPNEEAYYNTAIGFKSMNQNMIGDYNTAVGAESLLWNHSNYNSAFGYHALHENNIGEYNTASGAWSLYSNVSGVLNTASGYYSLYTNTSGHLNTAIGIRALYLNTSGSRNTALGSYSLNSNLIGNYNTATGYYAMYYNNLGIHNTGNGYRALYNNTTGNYNTAHGAYSLDNSFGGNYNTALGYDAGPTVDLLNNTTAIGYLAVPTASNQVRIGNTSITSIGGYAGWTDLSDGRFKKDIKEDVSGLDFITHLRPVSYVVDKTELNKFLHVTDSSGNQAEAESISSRQTGFIAQEVEDLIKETGYVFSGVDAPENENDPYGIRYAAFVVPLVKAVQELSANDEMQRNQIEEQRQKIDSLLALLGSRSQNEVDPKTTSVLLQNNPNPFTSETEIRMTVPDQVRNASVMIYNLEGKQMKNMQVNDRGEVSVKILGNELSAGMYLYTLIADGKVVDTKRMVLTR